MAYSKDWYPSRWFLYQIFYFAISVIKPVEHLAIHFLVREWYYLQGHWYCEPACLGQARSAPTPIPRFLPQLSPHSLDLRRWRTVWLPVPGVVLGEYWWWSNRRIQAECNELSAGCREIEELYAHCQHEVLLRWGLARRSAKRVLGSLLK